jgi:hypothetical protein
VCKRNKGEIVKAPGLLQSLHISNQIWEYISMELVTNLPKSVVKDVIFVVMNILIKYARFGGIQSTYTTNQVVEVFMKKIHRLHGFPKLIFSDKYPKFIGKFSKKL